MIVVLLRLFAGVLVPEHANGLHGHLRRFRFLWSIPFKKPMATIMIIVFSRLAEAQNWRLPPRSPRQQNASGRASAAPIQA